MTQGVTNLSAMQETWVRPLDGDDPLGKGMATQFSILSWRIPCREEPRLLICLNKATNSFSLCILKKHGILKKGKVFLKSGLPWTLY